MKAVEFVSVMQRFLPYAHERWVLHSVAYGELPLPPVYALQLVDELVKLRIPIMGLDGWEYTNDGSYVVETFVYFSVGDDVLASDDAVERSAMLVKDYIQTQLPKDIPLVAFTLDLSDEFINEARELLLKPP
jgi:hypothetical protein